MDTVGVTESEKEYSKARCRTRTKESFIFGALSLERLAHNEVSDDNLMLLRDYCSTINRRYEESVLFSRHLDYFITELWIPQGKLAK